MASRRTSTRTSDDASTARAPRRRPDFEKVIAVVQEMLDTSGEAGVRIEQVCARAEVSPSSLYAEFGDRQGLIAAARARQLEENHRGVAEFMSSVIEAASDPADYRRRVAEVTGIVHDDSRRPQRSLRCSVYAGTVGHPGFEELVRDEQTTLTDQMAEVIRTGQARGFIDPERDPRTVSVFLQALAFGISVADFDREMDADAWQAWRDLVQEVYDVVLQPGSSRFHGR